MLLEVNNGTLILLLALEFSILLISEARNPFQNRITSIDRISHHGYPAESHKIVTSDGFILQLFRIPHSSKEPQQKQQEKSSARNPRPAVLLLHGMSSSSDVFLLNGPNDGLPFLLADAGYDIWLGNARGNIYSRKHTKLSPKTRSFWKFSWHEIGAIDVATMIDYILKLTDQTRLHYIGHSQGATVYLVLMSTRPEYNEKIRTAHLLGPVAFMDNCEDGAIISVAPYVGEPGKLTNRYSDYEMFPHNPYVQHLLTKACGGNVSFTQHCGSLFGVYTGGESDNINMTLASQLAETHPAGASTNQLIHFAQEYVAKEFRRFDYGSKRNLLYYGQRKPPRYELEQVTSDVYIYYSDYDVTAKSVDVKKLASILPNIKLFHDVSYAKWTHLDFNWAINVKSVVNDLIVEKCIAHDKQTNRTLKSN